MIHNTRPSDSERDESTGAHQAPRQHREGRHRPASSAAGDDKPDNFITVDQLVEDVGNLHARLVAALQGLRATTRNERDQLMLDAWIRDETTVTRALEDYRARTRGDQRAAADSETGDSRYLQYARLSAFDEAVEELEAALADDQDPEVARAHAEAAQGHLIAALEQLAELTESDDGAGPLTSLAELERAIARRRSSSQQSSRTL